MIIDKKSYGKFSIRFFLFLLKMTVFVIVNLYNKNKVFKKKGWIVKMLYQNINTLHKEVNKLTKQANKYKKQAKKI